MSGRYYGKYTGIVTDNKDPDKRGRVKVAVPTIFPEEETAWARPVLPYGFYFVPEVEARVWIEFEGGDLGLPLWTGLQYQKDDWPDEADEPTRRVIKTKAGHRIVFTDKDGEESIEVHDGKNDHVILLDQKGVHVSTKQGQKIDLADSAITLDSGQIATAKLESSKITLDCGASKVEVSAAMINVESPQIELNGAMVKLGRSGMFPILRTGIDMGVGNLGLPVVLVPGNPTVRG